MILLLNLLPIILLIIWALIFWLVSRKKDLDGRVKTGIVCTAGGIASIFMLALIQPSYLPKGEIVKTPVPSFEHKELEVQDRVKRTDTMKNYQRTKEMHEEFMTE
jgi:hypothetical protein